MTIHRRMPAFAALLFGLLLLAPGAAAADRPAPSDLLKPIPVPADRPGDWPPGDWVPVPRSELDALFERTHPAPRRPRRTWIESATWTATFDGDRSLRGGRLDAVVRHTGEQLELLSLEPLNLALFELRWSENEADWGMLGNGQAALLVDRGSGNLNGRWNLAGRRLPGSVEFDLQLPAAVVSRLRLTLPEEYELSASAGDVRQSRKIAQDGIREWEVDLGSRTECRLTIRQRRDAPTGLPLVLLETNHSYVVGEDAVLAQSQIHLEATGGPVDLLVFKVPAEASVYSVTYGNGSPLSWKTIPHEGQQLLAVRLGDSLLGRSRLIRIAAIATSTVGAAFVLPQPRLQWTSLSRESLKTIQDADFTGKQPGGVRPPVLLRGQAHVKVDAPLELHAIEPSGYRQTATVSTPGVSFSSTWEQYRSDAALKLELGYPQLRNDARLVTRLDVSETSWTATSQIEWSARAGKTFETACRVSPLWEVVDVRPRSQASALTNWEVREENGGRRTLSVEFRDAVAPDSPKSVVVTARRLSLPPLRPLRLPVVKPLERGSVEQLIAVAHPASTAPRLEAKSGFDKIEADEVPEFAADSKLWQSEDSSTGRSLFLLRSSSAAAEGRLHLENSAPALEARAWITLSVDSLQLQERIAVRYSPEGRPVDRVVVYLTNAAGDVAWKLQAVDSKPLEATRIDADRHRDWSLPAEGELWEIRLPHAFTDRFVIVGTRSQSVAASMMPTLAVVPRAKSFDGVVELKTAGGLLVETTMDGPVPLEAHELDRRKFPGLADSPPTTGRLWRFRSAEQSVLLRLRGGPAGAALRPTAAVSLTSVLSDETPGFDRHSAVLRFLGGVRGDEIRFQLPEPAVLLSTSLNGAPVPVRRSGNDWVLVNPEGDSRFSVQIEYHTPSGVGRLGGHRLIPIPQFNYEILEFDWQFATPPDLWLVREPSGMILDEPLTELSWTERFFGPLGRPASRPLFNPFSAAAWARLGSAAPAVPVRQGAAATDQFVPPGWTIHRAAAGALPPELTVSTRRHSQAWLLAWLATLGCLIFGLLMRARNWAFRKEAFGYWLSGCLFAAWLSPPFYALCAGGCIVGTTVSLLFPRRLLEKLQFAGKPSADVVPLGSTASFRNAPATLLLLIALLCAARSIAQDAPAAPKPLDSVAPAAREAAASLEPIRMLVPSRGGDSPGEKDDIVYVERSRLAELKNLADRDAAAKYLIAAADYSARVDEQNAVVVTARYRVHLLPGVPAARVAFPDVAANPGRCLVNGRPHRVALAEDEQHFYVDLHQTEQEQVSAAARFDVLIELHPATESMRGGHGYRLNVVPVANARLEQQFAVAQPTIRLEGGRGEHSVGDDHRRLSALLGSTTRFRLLWSPNERPVQAPARLEARITTDVQAHPTWLQLRYRVDYRRVGGQVEFVEWGLPFASEEIVVREVTLDGQRTSDYSLFPAQASTSRMLVQFAAPQQRDFAVEALLLVPLPPPGRQEFRVPAAPLVEQSAEEYSVTVAQNLLGITAGPEYIVTPAAAASTDGVKSISIEAFRQRTGERASARTPQFAYEVTAAGPGPAFELTPALPVRKIRKMIQTGIVRGDSLNWTLGAEIETSRAPAFHHRLRVPPQLTIDDVSVREDQAERLVHWSRSGPFVELFLSDKTTGIQSVTLQGTREFSRPSPVALPLIGIEGADVEESQVKLLYDPEWVVGLVRADSLQPVKTTAPAGEGRGELELLGQFRLLPEGEPPQIRVESPAENFQADSVVTVSRQTAGSWRVDYHYRFSRIGGGPPIARVRLRIPPDLADSHRVNSPGLRQRAAVQADGSIELDLIRQLPPMPPFGQANGELSVEIFAAVDEPLPGEWSPPLIAAKNVAPAAGYLLVSNKLELKPEPAADLRSVAAPWPEQVASLVGPEAVEDGWTLYSSGSSAWKFLAGSTQGDPDTPEIPLVESRVMRRSGGDTVGRTTLWIQHSPDGEAELNWPGALALRALFVDGQPVASARPDPQENRLAIPLTSGPGAHRAELYWRRKPAPTAWWSPQSLPLPTPRQKTVGRSLLAVVPPAETRFTPRGALVSCGRLEYALEVLEGLFAACRRENGRTEHAPLWNELENQHRFVQQSLEGDEQTSSDQSERQALRQRFEQIDRQIAEARSQRRPAGSERAGKPDAGIAETNILRAAPNRNLLLGRLTDTPAAAPADISYWAVDYWTATALCLLVGLPLLFPLVRRIIRLEIGGWLFSHQPAAWALLGILWWSCLRAGELGILLVAVSVVLAVRERRQPQTEPASTIKAPPTGSAEARISHSSR